MGPAQGRAARQVGPDNIVAGHRHGSPSLSAAAVADLPPDRFGIGSAVNQAVRHIGSVLGVALTVVVVGRATSSLFQFRSLFLWQTALAIVTAFLSAPISTRRRD